MNAESVSSQGRIKQTVHAALSWLRSYRGSVVTLSALCLLLAVWVVPFQLTGQSKATIDAIAWGWLPLQIAYALTGLATLYCTYARLKRDIRRANLGPRVSDQPGPMAVPLGAARGLDDVEKALLTHGYSVTAVGKRLVAVKNRWSALGGSVFHLAILLFALAVYFQYATAQTAQVRVIEGQSFTEASVGEESWVANAVAGFALKSIEPTYFQDVLLFTGLDSVLTDPAGATRDSSLSQPLWLDMFTHLSVQDYGIAPSFKVKDSKGKVLDDTTVALALNPPGARDSVTLPMSRITLSVVAFPDYGILDGKDVSLTYNLRNPRLRLSATRELSGSEIARGLLGVGQSMRLGEYTIELTGVSRHGTFSLFRSYATLPIALASLLMMAGLMIRLFLPRHDVAIWVEGDELFADAWLDSFGREQGLRRLDMILAESE